MLEGWRQKDWKTISSNIPNSNILLLVRILLYLLCMSSKTLQTESCSRAFIQDIIFFFCKTYVLSHVYLILPAHFWMIYLIMLLVYIKWISPYITDIKSGSSFTFSSFLKDSVFFGCSFIMQIKRILMDLNSCRRFFPPYHMPWVALASVKCG